MNRNIERPDLPYTAASRRRPGPLSRSQERELYERREKGEPGARDVLVSSNLGFVVKVARNYRGMGLPFEDLLNEGNIGLIEAAERYDPAHGTKFITYAIWWIRKSILRALSEKSRVVRIPQSETNKIRQIRLAHETLQERLGRAPTREEISTHLSAKLPAVERSLGLTRHQLDLDEPLKDGGDATLGDLLTDDGTKCPEEEILRHERIAVLEEALWTLDTRSRRVLVRRFGLDGEPPQTLRTLSETLGLSRERVRQIEQRALGSLRRHVTHRDRQA